MLEQFEKTKIAVLMGGPSREREISFKTGHAIHESLKKQGYQVVAIDTKTKPIASLVAEEPGAAIIALHGRYGEDGTIQGVLETMEIPYSGSGILASAICMDKIITKELVTSLGITVPESQVVSNVSETESFHLSLPVIIKPNREGSTLGMTIVRNNKGLMDAIDLALQYDGKVLIEKYIAGAEVTVGLINGKSLPVLEVVPRSGFYDFDAKYTKGMTEYIVPARIPEAIADQLQQESETIFHHLELSGIVRVDYIIDKNQTPYFLEVNTIPGMTETSLIPKAAEKAGLSFDQVVEAMLSSVSLKI